MLAVLVDNCELFDIAKSSADSFFGKRSGSWEALGGPGLSRHPRQAKRTKRREFRPRLEKDYIAALLALRPVIVGNLFHSRPVDTTPTRHIDKFMA